MPLQDVYDKGPGIEKRNIPTAQRDADAPINAANNCGQAATGAGNNCLPDSLRRNLDALERRLRQLNDERAEINWAIQQLVTDPKVADAFRTSDIVQRCRERSGQ